MEAKLSHEIGMFNAEVVAFDVGFGFLAEFGVDFSRLELKRTLPRRFLSKFRWQTFECARGRGPCPRGRLGATQFGGRCLR